MKTLWMTSLIRSEDTVKNLFSQMKTYGLDLKGHFWEDDLDKIAWIGARDELIKPDVALWLILASQEELVTPSLRYGLSLLAITVQAKKGIGFPIVILHSEGDPSAFDTLPTPLKGVDFLSLAESSLGAKIVAKVHSPVKEIALEYRLDAYGNPQIGQWFEVGPQKEVWKGTMFGVSGGEITFHGVGPKGSLPSHSTLNYPSQGLKLKLGEREYTAWAVKNEIDSGTSYFVQVKGYPESFVFSSFSTEEETDVYVVTVK
jgi:hypothetical protein